FAAYVLPVLALVLARMRTRRALVTALLAGLVGGVLALPWYGPRLLGMAPQVAARSFRQAAESGHPEPLTATALTFYPRWFVPQFGLGVPLLLGSPPTRDDWRHRDILALLAQDSRGDAATVSVVPNDNFFSVSNFRYYGVRQGLPLRWARGWDGEPVGVDYMILKTGAQGPVWTAERPRRIAERLAADVSLARAYPVIGEWTLPDGSTATLRARRLEPGVVTAPTSLARAAERAVRRRLAEVARDVEGLEVRIVHGDSIRRGRLERIEIVAGAATVGDLSPRNAAV